MKGGFFIFLEDVYKEVLYDLTFFSGYLLIITKIVTIFVNYHTTYVLYFIYTYMEVLICTKFR